MQTPTAQRHLRSRRLRSLLYEAVDGRCEACGGDLDGLWEADHAVAWKDRQRTNVHEMRALCRTCNRKKGSMSLRTVQQRVQDFGRGLIAGTYEQRLIVAKAYPGSGKSQLPPILACELLGRVVGGRRIDNVCWVTPRIALQTQAVDAFRDPYFRKLLGHSYRIR